MEEDLRYFLENGYTVIPGALSDAEVQGINQAIEADQGAHPDLWEPRPIASGHLAVGCDVPELMLRTEGLDAFAHHPSIVPTVRGILGDGAQLCGMTYLIRVACPIDPPEDMAADDPLCLTQVWHREDSGNIEGAEMNDNFAPAVQAIIYLDDVDEESHCFSIIPESAETKRNLPKADTGSTGWGVEGRMRIDDEETGYVDSERPNWLDGFGREIVRRKGGVNIHGQAGSAVLLNNSSWHCGTIRQTKRQRRTLHIRYRQPEPVESRHGLKEPLKSVAEFNAALPDRPGIGSM
jgi:hypothetical protein